MDTAFENELRPHPASEIFPVMSCPDFEALVADIKLNGQIEPIVVHDNLILDGRHRYKACLRLGIVPRIINWNDDGKAEAFVISKNLHRRHLTETQRAMVAARFATRQKGTNQHRREDAQICAPSQHEAAKLLNVSRRAVQHAAAVIDKGAPELVQAVERGVIAVSRAAELTRLPMERQTAIAAMPDKLVKREALKAVRRIGHQRPVARAQQVDDHALGDHVRVEIDPEFQAEAQAAARDLEMERDERIAISGAGALEDENQKLRVQIATQDKRIAELLDENAALKQRARMWKGRALAAGWKAPSDG